MHHLKMGQGFWQLEWAHPRPTQIWVPPGVLLNSNMKQSPDIARDFAWVSRPNARPLRAWFKTRSLNDRT